MLVSHDSNSATTTANGDSFDVSISADGRFAAYASEATNLVAGLTYANTETDVELRAYQSLTRDLELQNIVTLEDIRVVARRTRYAEFEAHRAS